MKANYQSVNSYGEICEAVGQSIVECRLPATEIVKVLLCQPQVSLTEAVCENGEIRYGGKLLVSFLYEDVAGKLCRAERGAEFFHKAENPNIAPAHSAVGDLTLQNVKIRREGGQIVASCVVEGKFSVTGQRRHTYLLGGESLYVEKTATAFCSEFHASVTIEEDDEFECEFAQDILLHSESVLVTDVRASVGEVEARAELCLQFCMLRADGSLCSYERLTPIKAQIALDNAMSGEPVKASARILSAHVSAATDEERGKSKIVVSYRVQFMATVYERTEYEVATDAYSKEMEIQLKADEVHTMYAMNTRIQTERVHGTIVLGEASGLQSEEKTLLAAVFPKASASIEKTSSGAEIQGVIEAKALYRLPGGGIEAVDVALPFLFPADLGVAECDESQLVCGVYGFGLRVRSGGETEAEATLKMCITSYAKERSKYIAEVLEGEKKVEKTCAVSIYVPTAGDSLWTTAKRLSLAPEEVTAANPGLTFPLIGEERILVYRQKREKL